MAGACHGQLLTWPVTWRDSSAQLWPGHEILAECIGKDRDTGAECIGKDRDTGAECIGKKAAQRMWLSLGTAQLQGCSSIMGAAASWVQHFMDAAASGWPPDWSSLRFTGSCFALP
eukprot:363474-Chlamydomonas_euryale.AAC.15